MMRWKEHFYRLRDPRDNEIRYIGRTNYPKSRRLQHCRMKKLETTPVAIWERELINLGLKPIFEIIKIIEFHHDWSVVPHIIPGKWPNEIERELIQEHLELGCKLLNFQMVKTV